MELPRGLGRGRGDFEEEGEVWEGGGVLDLGGFEFGVLGEGFDEEGVGVGEGVREVGEGMVVEVGIVEDDNVRGGVGAGIDVGDFISAGGEDAGVGAGVGVGGRGTDVGEGALELEAVGGFALGEFLEGGGGVLLEDFLGQGVGGEEDVLQCAAPAGGAERGGIAELEGAGSPAVEGGNFEGVLGDEVAVEISIEVAVLKGEGEVCATLVVDAEVQEGQGVDLAGGGIGAKAEAEDELLVETVEAEGFGAVGVAIGEEAGAEGFVAGEGLGEEEFEGEGLALEEGGGDGRVSFGVGGVVATGDVEVPEATEVSVGVRGGTGQARGAIGEG